MNSNSTAKKPLKLSVLSISGRYTKPSQCYTRR